MSRAGTDHELPNASADVSSRSPDGSSPSPAGADLLGAVTGGWRLDLAGDTAWWSPEMYEIFGVDPTTFTPTLRNLRDLVEPDSFAKFSEQVAAWRERPQPFAATYQIVRPGGERRLIEVRGWTDLDPEDHPRQILGTARDITVPAAVAHDRERLSRQRAMILEAAGDGICGLDVDGRVTFCNPALKALMRRDDECLEELRLHDLVHRDNAGIETHPASECPFHRYGAEPSSATDAEFHRADGVRLEVSYMLVSIDDDEVRGGVVSFRDITASRSGARLLQTSLQQVRTLAAQRGALLEHLAEAEERERLRIAADIHDDTIQALGAVGLRLSHARRGSDGPALAVLTEAETEVKAATERLRKLMFELMPPIAGDDLRAAVEGYCSVLFVGSAIDYEVTGEIRGLVSDRYLLAYRLVQEALRNVLKHSRGTRVLVEFEATATDLVSRISDDGVGMDEAGGAETAAPTHAGLRIVRRRAEASGGTATVAAGLDGRGSSIELRLPLTWGDAR